MLIVKIMAGADVWEFTEKVIASGGMVYWPLDKIGEAHGDAALFRVGNSPPSEHDNSEMRIDG